MTTKFIIDHGKAYLVDEEKNLNEISALDLRKIIEQEIGTAEVEEEEIKTETETSKAKVAELCIHVGTGQATVMLTNEIEFHDCTPIHVDILEYILKEAKEFIKYRDSRQDLL